MDNTTYYTPEGFIGNDWRLTGYRVVARVHYADTALDKDTGERMVDLYPYGKAITLPRQYDTEHKALLACVALTVNDQQVEVSRRDELARLAGSR